MKRGPALLALLLVCAAIDAAPRSRAMRAEFQRTNPCPANGNTRGPCPGWQADHILPLCAGGADRADQLQWLTVAEHAAKTRSDVAFCRRYMRTP